MQVWDEWAVRADVPSRFCGSEIFRSPTSEWVAHHHTLHHTQINTHVQDTHPPSHPDEHPCWQSSMRMMPMIYIKIFLSHQWSKTHTLLASHPDKHPHPHHSCWQLMGVLFNILFFLFNGTLHLLPKVVTIITIKHKDLSSRSTPPPTIVVNGGDGGVDCDQDDGDE